MVKNKDQILAKIQSIEFERDLLKRAINVCVCPECGEDLNRGTIYDGPQHDPHKTVEYTCKCGFSHTREE